MPVVMGVPTLGPMELLIVLLIIVAVFGASRLAGIGSALGGSIAEFKKAVRDGDEEPAAQTESKTEQSETKTS